MQLRLEMPFVAKAMRHGTVAQWHVGEGSVIDFGSDLCDVLITEMDHRQTTVPVSYRVRIRASEPGILRAINAVEGSLVAIGDLLGVVSTDPSEPVDAEPAVGALAMRVVANDASEEDD